MVSTVIGTARRGNRNWVHLDVRAFNGLMEALETGNTLTYPVSDSVDPTGDNATSPGRPATVKTRSCSTPRCLPTLPAATASTSAAPAPTPPRTPLHSTASTYPRSSASRIPHTLATSNTPHRHHALTRHPRTFGQSFIPLARTPCAVLRGQAELPGSAGWTSFSSSGRCGEAGLAPCTGECPDHLLITGPHHLTLVLKEFAEHHNTHRPHRFLDQHPPAALPPFSATIQPLRRDRLGGHLHEYVHVA